MMIIGFVLCLNILLNWANKTGLEKEDKDRRKERR